MWLNSPASALTETSILYTEGHTDTRTDAHTDTRMDGHTGWFQYTLENIRFEAV